MDDQFDEFGNYIGNDQVIEEQPHEDDMDNNNEDELNRNEDRKNQIVLHEDKQYYQTAEEIYGSDVEVLYRNEDEQSITEGIIPVEKNKKIQREYKTNLTSKYDFEYISEQMNNIDKIRNIAVIGSLHHGKTQLIDLLFRYSHDKSIDVDKITTNYMDIRNDEQELKISIKSSQISLCIPSKKNGYYLCNIIDTPGHSDFIDEVIVGLSLADNVIITIDCAEGVLLTTKHLIEIVAQQHLPLIVVITKIDRLIIDLKLPPEDSYCKIRNIICEVNEILHKYQMKLISPENNTVLFESSIFGCLFSLNSFSEKYIPKTTKGTLEQRIRGAIGFDSQIFGQNMWGDKWFDHQTHTFKRIKGNEKRTFVEFILEPIYKIVGMCVSKEGKELKQGLKNFNIRLEGNESELNFIPLLRTVFYKFFGERNLTGFGDTLQELMTPKEAAQKVITKLSNDKIEMKDIIKKCDRNGPLVMSIIRLLPNTRSSEMIGVCKVYSGTIHEGDSVRVLGNNYSETNTEDMRIEEVLSVQLDMAQYKVPMRQGIPAGNICIVTGINQIISKNGTVVDKSLTEIQHIRNIEIPTPYIKVAIEPLKPSEKEIMIESLSKVTQSYPGSMVKCEDSGEYIITGYGEMYLDCILRDVRNMFTPIEIKVSDPCVIFNETVSCLSQMKSVALSTNHRNRIAVIIDPLDENTIKGIEKGELKEEKGRDEILYKKYQWDILASKSLLCIGPEEKIPNVLLNDILEEEKREKINEMKEACCIGFKWAMSSGPLCEEEMRNCRVRIIDAEFERNVDEQQVIQALRRSIYAGIILSSPQLLEPIYVVEIITPENAIKGITKSISDRRGFIIQQQPLEGTPFQQIHGNIPLIEIFGFETDIRTFSRGQAFVQSWFSHWGNVPGDPLDKEIKPLNLQPNPQPYLSREFMMKTRRRKGLVDDVDTSKYFDEEMLSTMSQNNFIF
ncbi:U5 small nuclear ribonucleoprotein subunit, putative [Entamoeba histolytica HM-1:IMSS-B]|uniref:116 kDa U5 small nuclear ribonucleoprotein component n=4 Tax=Entamoeba histolytica TaxID=5759 RepID=C4M7P1_ENTH1|nr:U5 small nuclear ribonucleoprotein subunit, putative [Entamoeba histolytica HM-1:IMSS]EAL51352.2 U5 small nuclear ribonucleoprotein subunit, putative [Entamoeba histolytica HM-1:IMSS]EMH76977.1 U5 small nuclear ribonucleoprotein subunit, putative [Entamoeba histolytica HM-1:IMSS-B]ENY62664.1 U5 small nuclear ribonucleoprotein component, putative [Entamoeba histolytica HM-1:IMSS-A]GAT97564.1 u5 small nuclear ribonucleoprotein subunit putative [Entamoeba histolytica]|eukprot:XP_656735.2 U5 small nuclear ribonucleoprotein subunit, putative [Entamoeba histolytica HM-1:IMSS]